MDHRRQMLTLAVVGVAAWAAFLCFFRVLWPTGYDPPGDRGVLVLWFAVGSVAVLASFAAAFRLARTPRRWRSSAAVALSAPAFCLDALATTFFHDWFPDAGAGDDGAYAALILGTVGIALLFSLFTTDPA